MQLSSVESLKSFEAQIKLLKNEKCISLGAEKLNQVILSSTFRKLTYENSDYKAFEFWSSNILRKYFGKLQSNKV